MNNANRNWSSSTIRQLSAVVAIVGICLGVYLGYLQVSGNFHTVIDGELYRSAQPSPSELEAYVRQHGIRTVINLRGPEGRKSWYETEVATAKRLGLNHVDFAMSSTRDVTPEKAAKLVAIMRDAPKPILIHCKAGADRSGIAAALYSYEIAGQDEETAERQLSIRFGHIGIPYLSRTFAMDRSWEALRNSGHEADSYRPSGRKRWARYQHATAHVAPAHHPPRTSVG